MIVEKAVKMAQMMDIPILGVVENMSYIRCGKCGEKVYPFGESHLDQIAAEYGLDILGTIPMDPAIAAACDEGRVEDLDGAAYLADAIEKLKK